MSDLLNVLGECEEEISRAYTDRLWQADCPTLDCPTILQALVACCRSDDEATPQAWAAALRSNVAGSETAGSELPLSNLLAALNCLEQAVRLQIVKRVDQKTVLMLMLSELAAAIDRLRQCYVESAPPASSREKVLEQALSESESRKHSILESALDPIITINHEGVITEFNRAAERAFGHAREKVLGTKPSDVLFPASMSTGHQNRIDRYLDAGDGSMLGRRVEVTAVRADGETFPAEMAMTISHEQGNPVLTFFVRDISLRKKAERQQARYQSTLQRSNRQLEQFAYVASHDLQEPLRKIRAFGDRLQRRCGEQLDEAGRECVERMQSAAGRMQTLIEGLLTLSRVTTRHEMFERVDLGTVAREVVSDLEVQIDRTGGRVELGKLPTVKADPVQMRQLLQNLIANALKFRRDDVPPVVKVHGRYVQDRRQQRSARSARQQKCRILVEDNGIGFEEKHLERMFEIFGRLHSRDVYEGTGIGLPICRKIVERHGGSITARSTPGKGSAFEVILPVIPAKRPQN